MKKEQELYRKIQRYAKSHELVSATIISGEDIGEKILLSDGEMMWKSENADFLEVHKDKLLEKNETVFELEGRRIYREKPETEKKLVICGGGHVSIPIIQIGKSLGLQVTVLEDRPLFADHARKAGADEVLCNSFEESLKQIEGGKDTYFVIVTRGHRYDKECLRRISEKTSAYTGMMGSRRRVAMVKEQLREEGISEVFLQTLHSPIGLEIHAETPAEIAVSVMAEIISIKNQSQKGCSYEKALLEILSKETNEKKALVTIVSRKGSAPREVGTKMIVLGNGCIFGTIGGGCMENEVVQRILTEIKEENPVTQTWLVDLTMEAAEDEGMVCGGKVEVLVEFL